MKLPVLQLNKQCFVGETLLHEACKYGSDETVKTFLNKSNLQVLDNLKNYPAYYCCHDCHINSFSSCNVKCDSMKQHVRTKLENDKNISLVLKQFLFSTSENYSEVELLLEQIKPTLNTTNAKGNFKMNLSFFHYV